MNLKQNLIITYSNQKARELKKTLKNPLDKVVTLSAFVNDFFENKNTRYAPKNINEVLIKSDGEVEKSSLVLEKDFYFNYSDNKLYLNKKEIHLSEIENKIFKLLIDNRNKIVKFEDFQNIWDDKLFFFILKNFIKRIKNKTYNELITTFPNQGYMLIIK